MKILVVCQYYKPEPFRVSDICEELVRRGHEVKVVTGEPNYPEGNIYEGYENHQHSDETLSGVNVHRCHIIPRKTGAIYRLLNYYSYSRSAKKYVKSSKCIASDGSNFDVVFVNQLSPVMMAEPAIEYKKKYGVPVVMYCLDLWPESLIAGGISRDSKIFKVFHAISGRIYKSVDRILITSRMFKGYLKEEFGISDKIINYLPQYAEGVFEKMPYRKEEGVTNIVFAGNIGTAQSIDTILYAALKLKDKPVQFHIVGGGTELDRLKQESKRLSLDNTTFYGRYPLDEMPRFYLQADAMLITLKSDPALSLTLPGKVQSYMAAGKPIIGAIDGEASEVIRIADCGFCGPAENSDELAQNIIRFMESDRKEQMGKNARLFYELNYNKKVFMDNLEKELMASISTNEVINE